jgi:hypothetical protein
VSLVAFFVSGGGSPRHAVAPIVFITVLVLLLVERELVRAWSGRAARSAIPVFAIAVVPLLVAFAIVITLRFAEILGP